MSASRSSAFGAACLLLLAAAGAAPAQQPDSSAHELVSILREAQSANRMVRFRSQSGELAEGRLTWVGDSAVKLGQRRVALAAQRQLEVRIAHPDPLWTGTLIGAGIAALVFANTDWGEPNMSRREKAGLLLAGTATGGLFGFLIDSAIEPPGEWRLLWRQQPR